MRLNIRVELMQDTPTQLARDTIDRYGDTYNHGHVGRYLFMVVVVEGGGRSLLLKEVGARGGDRVSLSGRSARMAAGRLLLSKLTLVWIYPAQILY